MNRLEEFIKNPLFLSLVSNLSDCLYVIDINGCVIYANQTALDFEKQSFDSIVGKHITEIYTQEVSPSLTALNSGQIVEEHENSYMINGKEFHQICKSVPIYVGSELVGVYTIQRDITSMRRMINNDIKYQKAASTDKKKRGFEALIGQDAEFVKCVDLGKIASDSESPVLLCGLTGSGKELFARAIHNTSARSKQPFIAINCAAIPDGLMESLLFGTSKGSFTGSMDKPGLFEQAKGGTLFLDEINSMPISSQSKLLRVLEEKEVRRVGGSSDIQTDVRIISSINTFPQIAIKEGQLRTDLFYRLSVMTITIPALSTRKEDIKLLTSYFIKKYNDKLNRQIIGLDSDVMSFFMTYDWPGNVRQLKHVIESAINISRYDENYIKLEHIPQYLFENQSQVVETIVPQGMSAYPQNEIYSNGVPTASPQPQKASNSAYSDYSTGSKLINEPTIHESVNTDNLYDTIRNNEKRMIIDALMQSGGNVSKASRLLNMNRQNLVYRMKKYGIKR